MARMNNYTLFAINDLGDWGHFILVTMSVTSLAPMSDIEFPH
jgi:hypothetical protein